MTVTTTSTAAQDTRQLGRPTLSPPRPTVHRSLRIAMLGLKGLPATYGGVERHVEEVGARLVARGHDVTIYCRTSYGEDVGDEYRGMKLRRLPALATKHLDAISHTALSTADAMSRHFDVIHYHALGPGLLSPIARCARCPRVVQTVHGLDNERAKWGVAARTILGTAHWVSGHVPDATVVVSRDLGRHYSDRFRHPVTVIPNGVTPHSQVPATSITQRFGVEAGKYALFVGRLVPEKNPDLLIRAWRNVDGPWRLVVAGGSSFSDAYAVELRRLAGGDDRVVFTDYVYGDALAELFSNAATFVLPSALEGMPLTLLEAASYEAPIVASDIPPHREVLRDDGPGHHLVPVGDEARLTDVLQRVLDSPASEHDGAAAASRRIVAEYTWDATTEALESLYQRLCAPQLVPRQRQSPGA
jgi:glycosyltransferase involved in cell wall biosynthesis